MGDKRNSCRNEGYGTLSTSDKQADSKRDLRHRDSNLDEYLLMRVCAKRVTEWLVKMRNAYKLGGDYYEKTNQTMEG